MLVISKFSLIAWCCWTLVKHPDAGNSDYAHIPLLPMHATGMEEKRKGTWPHYYILRGKLDRFLPHKLKHRTGYLSLSYTKSVLRNEMISSIELIRLSRLVWVLHTEHVLGKQTGLSPRLFRLDTDLKDECKSDPAAVKRLDCLCTRKCARERNFRSRSKELKQATRGPHSWTWQFLWAHMYLDAST